MSKILQIREVPDATHAKLKELADAADKTMNEYLRDVLERVVKGELDRPAAPPAGSPGVPVNEPSNDVFARMRASGVGQKRDMPR